MERETPRVNAFITLMEPTRLDPDDFVSQTALIKATHEIRKLMVAWSDFARTLEREIDAYENPVEEPRQ